MQRAIAAGVIEGARLVAGGPGRPEGLASGYYARPTVFADVPAHAAVAKEEIFGPVRAQSCHLAPAALRVVRTPSDLGSISRGRCCA